MSDVGLELKIREEDMTLFKRSVRKLLESTFVLRDKDEKLYAFVSRESNRQSISEYLRMVGFDLLVEQKSGVCMLVESEEDAETVGLKWANVVSFSTLQYHMLLVLWKLYLEQLGYQEACYVIKGDLIDKLQSYGAEPTRPELSSSLKLFKKYSLINFDEDEDGAEMQIRLYPSLQFGWDVPQFEVVAREYIKADETEADESQAEKDAFEEAGE